MYDYGTGLDLKTFRVTAEVAVDGVPAGKDLGGKFKSKGGGVWELRLARAIEKLPRGTLTVSVQDKQGNVSRIVRTFSVGKPAARN
jgi:hypothetical protein